MQRDPTRQAMIAMAVTSLNKVNVGIANYAWIMEGTTIVLIVFLKQVIIRRYPLYIRYTIKFFSFQVVFQVKFYFSAMI